MAEIWASCDACERSYYVPWREFVRVEEPPACVVCARSPGEFEVRVGELSFPLLVNGEHALMRLSEGRGEVSRVGEAP